MNQPENALLFNPEWFPLCRSRCEKLYALQRTLENMINQNRDEIAFLIAEECVVSDAFNSNANSFWEEFVPCVCKFACSDWNHWHKTSISLAAQWPADVFHSFRLMWGGLICLLTERLERMRTSHSHMDLVLFSNLVIMKGSVFTSHVLRDGVSVESMSASMSAGDIFHKFAFIALLWADVLRVHCVLFQCFIAPIIDTRHGTVYACLSTMQPAFGRWLLPLSAALISCPEVCQRWIAPVRFGDWTRTAPLA